MKSKSKTTNTKAIVLLVSGLVVAFFPTLSRLFGNELILTSSTKTDEWLTMLISLVGGTLVGLSILGWKTKNGQGAKGLAFSIGILVSIVAIALNVLSIFAFTL